MSKTKILSIVRGMLAKAAIAAAEAKTAEFNAFVADLPIKADGAIHFAQIDGTVLIVADAAKLAASEDELLRNIDLAALGFVQVDESDISARPLKTGVFKTALQQVANDLEADIKTAILGQEVQIWTYLTQSAATFAYDAKFLGAFQMTKSWPLCALKTTVMSAMSDLTRVRVSQMNAAFRDGILANTTGPVPLIELANGTVTTALWAIDTGEIMAQQIIGEGEESKVMATLLIDSEGEDATKVYLADGVLTYGPTKAFDAPTKLLDLFEAAYRDEIRTEAQIIIDEQPVTLLTSPHLVELVESGNAAKFSTILTLAAALGQPESVAGTDTHMGAAPAEEAVAAE